MSVCKQCGLSVVWVKIIDRWHCHNLDGSDHWDLCSQTRTSKIISTGTPFKEDRNGAKVEGYKTALKKSGEMLIKIAAKTRKKKIHTEGCRQCVPPWEHCPNNCPIEFRKS